VWNIYVQLCYRYICATFFMKKCVKKLYIFISMYEEVAHMYLYVWRSCMYVSITQLHIYIFIHVDHFTCMKKLHIYIYIYMYIYIHIYTHIHIHIHIHIYIYMYIWIYTYIHLCIYIHLHMHLHVSQYT